MHENGQDSRAQRGVFLDDGMVEMVIPYHKGFSFSQKVKIIQRYVPREVGESIVYHLWLIKPFVCQLQAMARDQESFSSFLREPKPEEEWEDDEYKGMPDDTKKRLRKILDAWDDDE